MLGEEVVDRICRGAVTARPLECERLQGRACCRAEIVVLGSLALTLYTPPVSQLSLS